MIMRNILFFIFWLSSAAYAADSGGYEILASDKTLKYLYHDGASVYLEICARGHELAGEGDTSKAKFCKVLLSPISTMDLSLYQTGLAVAFNVDSDLILSNLDKIRETLADYKVRLDSETDPEKLLKLRAKIDRIEAQLPRIEGYQKILSQLLLVGNGDPQTLDEDIDRDDIAKIIAPYFTKLPENASYQEDPHSGWAFQKLEDICFYDLGDKKRPQDCLKIEEGKYDFPSNYLQIPYEYHPAVSPNRKPGCKSKNGNMWQIASSKELAQLALFYELKSPIWTNEGALLRFRFNDDELASDISRRIRDEAYRISKIHRYNWGDYQDIHLFNFSAVCVAEISEVNPYGDIDQDGVPNHLDRCNTFQANLLGEVYRDGEHIGCAVDGSQFPPVEPLTIEQLIDKLMAEVEIQKKVKDDRYFSQHFAKLAAVLDPNVTSIERCVELMQEDRSFKALVISRTEPMVNLLRSLVVSQSSGGSK